MKKRVLFVCYGNSCRSILAEALARHTWGNSVDACSAGMDPLGYVTPYTLEVLREIGVLTAGFESKPISAIDLSRVDLVVNLTNDPIRPFLPAKFPAKVVDWYVMDPFGEGLGAFRQARDAIRWLVTEQLPKWLASQVGSTMG